MKKSNNVCIWLSTLARGARLQVAQGASLLDLNGDGGHCRVAWLRVLVLVAALLAGLGDGLAGALDAVIPTLQVDVKLGGAVGQNRKFSTADLAAERPTQ